MDTGSLAAGITSTLGDFGTDYGPVLLIVVGIGLAVFGLDFLIAYLKKHVRVRAPKS